MSLFDGKPTTATEEHLRAPWMGGKNGKYFRCAMSNWWFHRGER